MNERIKELAEQSGAGWDDKYHWYVGSETMEKFAELIVGECAKRIDYWESRQGEHCDDLLKHFGVE